MMWIKLNIFKFKNMEEHYEKLNILGKGSFGVVYKVMRKSD